MAKLNTIYKVIVMEVVNVFLSKILIQTPEEDGDVGRLHVCGQDKREKSQIFIFQWESRAKA